MITCRRLLESVIFVSCSIAATRSALCFENQSAREFLVHFCALDAAGGQLSPDGWQKIASMFVEPGTPRHDKIVVVRDFVVSNPAVETRRATFYVEYIELGRIDLSNSSFLPVPSLKVRTSFEVTNKAAVSSNREAPAEWRIAGPIPEPRLTVEAALRYATETRTNAKGPIAREKAGDLVAALNRLR